MMETILWLSVLMVGVFLSSGYVYRRYSGRCTSNKRMDGTTVIITGASSGIGTATAYDLARRGARVIMACRNSEKGQHIADQIKVETGNSKVIVEVVDLADLDSVRRFCYRIKTNESALHVLINNAGTGISTKKLTAQNLEITMATNHYGHFLLTNLLLDMLKSTPSSRIINVSSKLHEMVTKLDLNDLNFTNADDYSVMRAYSQSKLCNILFTKQLSRKLQGTGVTANCLHPGIVATGSFQKVGTWKGYIYGKIVDIIGKDCESGAQTSIHLAVSDEVKNTSGKYFVDCKESACSGLADDVDLAKGLWYVSERDVRLQDSEKYY